MIPFSNTWPYEKMGKDIYIHTCPYCQKENVLTNMKATDLARAKESIKTILIMPCCHEKMTILEADDDYFLTDTKLRG